MCRGLSWSNPCRLVLQSRIAVNIVLLPTKERRLWKKEACQDVTINTI